MQRLDWLTVRYLIIADKTTQAEYSKVALVKTRALVNKAHDYRLSRVSNQASRAHFGF